MRRENPVTDKELNPEDLITANEFIKEYGTLQKLVKGSIVKYHASLWAILAEVKRGGHTIATLDREASLNLIRFLQDGNKWSEDTRDDYWKRFLLFYQWARDRKGDTWNADVAKLFCDGKQKYRYRRDKNKLVKKGTFTPEEILSIVHAETSTPYQVFWSVLYESGMRAGEAFALRIENVKPIHGKGYALELPRSKTERRTIPILGFSKDFLGKWLSLHPQKDDNGALLFTNTLGEPLTGASANKRLREIVKAIGMKKRKISLHSFRHSRAGELANILTEAQLCALFGWTVGSNMPRTYIRTQALDVTRALSTAYGLEERPKHEVTGRTCISCGHLNAMVADWCAICKLPLDGKKLEELRNGVDALKMQASYEAMTEKLHAKLIGEVTAMIASQK